MTALKYTKIIPTDVLECVHEGKIRDTYVTNDPDCLAVVASDRVSTHDMVHLSTIPYKGEVLTMLTIYWLTRLLPDVPNHLVAHGQDIYKFLPDGFRDQFPELHYRTVIIRKLEMIPVEFVLRQYLTGSLLKQLTEHEDPHGLGLSSELPIMHRFDNLLFTPTEKSETDKPLNAAVVAEEYAEALKLAEYVFTMAAGILAEADICLVDTKFELGVCAKTGTLMLADEVITPDSSRFTPLSDLVSGVEPVWLDKQVVRNKVEEFWKGSFRSPLVFTEDIIIKTVERYVTLLQSITGRTLHQWRESLC